MKKVFLMVMVLVLAMSLTFSLVAFAAGEDGEVSILKGTKVSAFDNIGGLIIGAFQAVAGIAAVAILLYVGIKFMLASPAEKANIKGMLIPYIIGAILIFAAIPILGIFKNLGSTIEEETGDEGLLNNEYAVIIEK